MPPPEPGAVRQVLTNLLGAYGYNLYDDANRSRADDQLVRQQAGDALADVGNALRELRAAYRHRYIPPATREQPDPPRERLAQLDALTRLQQRFADLEVGVRSMPVPTSDRVWAQFRRERVLLSELLLQDYQLIEPCRGAQELAHALSVETWDDGTAAAALATLANQVEQATRGRQTLLHL